METMNWSEMNYEEQLAFIEQMKEDLWEDYYREYFKEDK